MPSTRVVGFQIWDDELIHFKEKFNLPLGRKDNIKIPKEFLSKDSFKKSIIRGIFLEKKNHKLYPRVYITTISFELSTQLLELFQGLGFRVTRYSQLYNQEFNRKRSYIVTIRGIEMFHKFMQEISPKNPKHIQKYEIFKKSQGL